MKKLPPTLPRDTPDYHQRQAAHFRALAESATTPLSTRGSLRRPKGTSAWLVAKHSGLVKANLNPSTGHAL